MNLPAIALSFWTVLGYYPVGQIANYQVPAIYIFDAGGYSEMGVKAGLAGFYLLGSVRTDLRHLAGELTLTPQDAEYVTAAGWSWDWAYSLGAGIRQGAVTIQALHVCTHPIDTWGLAMRLSGYTWQPNWESTHSEISLRLDL